MNTTPNVQAVNSLWESVLAQQTTILRSYIRSLAKELPAAARDEARLQARAKKRR